MPAGRTLPTYITLRVKVVETIGKKNDLQKMIFFPRKEIYWNDKKNFRFFEFLLNRFLLMLSISTSRIVRHKMVFNTWKNSLPCIVVGEPRGKHAFDGLFHQKISLTIFWTSRERERERERERGKKLPLKWLKIGFICHYKKVSLTEIINF